MTITSLKMYGRRIGAVSTHESSRAIFGYDPEFVAAAPLEPWLITRL